MKQSEIGFRALQFAITELEADAGEEGGNNAGPFIEKYLGGLAEPPANWCMAFMSWCVFQAVGSWNAMPFRYTLSTRAAFNELKSISHRHPEGRIVEIEEVNPGDLIFFWRGDQNGWMGHVGIVEKIAEDGTINTIEGNKGAFPAKVRRWNYRVPIPRLLGFVNLG